MRCMYSGTNSSRAMINMPLRGLRMGRERETQRDAVTMRQVLPGEARFASGL